MLAVTATLVAVKVAVVAPAATVTLAGTLDRAAAGQGDGQAPGGGAPLGVTVPVEEAPPTTVVGLKASAESVGAVTMSVAVL